MPQEPTEHPLWPVFLKLLKESPDWTFIGHHRDNDTLALWQLFRLGAEAEIRRILEAY
jgi:hypothetical protein